MTLNTEEDNCQDILVVQVCWLVWTLRLLISLMDIPSSFSCILYIHVNI